MLKAEPEERSVLSSEELAALERATLDVVGETVVARVPDGPVNSQRSKRTLCFLRPGARDPSTGPFKSSSARRLLAMRPEKGAQ